MLMSPFVEDIVDLVIEERVKVITTGAGSPGKYMKRFKEAGIIVIPVVASVAQAKRMEKKAQMRLWLKEWKVADILENLLP